MGVSRPPSVQEADHAIADDEHIERDPIQESCVYLRDGDAEGASDVRHVDRANGLQVIIDVFLQMS